MRMSQLTGNRFKERPADAVSDGQAVLLRGGYVRQIAPGSFALLTPAAKTTERIKSLLSRNFEALGFQRFDLPPMTQGDIPAGMLRLLRDDVKSHAQIPTFVYCLASISAPEEQPRAGLLRMRSFSAVLGISLHRTRSELDQGSCHLHNALLDILHEMGVDQATAAESSDTPAFGLPAVDLVVLSDSGDQRLAVCNSCSYKADMSVARGRFDPIIEPMRPLERVHTPGKKTIEEVACFLGIEPRQTAKAVFFDRDADGKLVLAIIRGDIEVNEAKLQAIIGLIPVPATEERILSVGAVPGYAAAMGLDPARVRVLMDHSVAESSNLVCGANDIDYHFRNFNAARDLPEVTSCDMATVQAGVGCPVCEGSLDIRSSIRLATLTEVGSSLADAEGLRVANEGGQLQEVWVGYWRIGIERLMGAIAETHCDQYGLKWPMSVAPWQVHICALRLENEQVRPTAENLYAQIRHHQIDVLYDDRNASAGVQFADADLLGAPVRLIVGERNLAQGNIEYKRRDTGEKGVLPLNDVLSTVTAWTNCRPAPST